MTTIKLKITDMHCANCAMRLQSLEDDLLGVKRVDASYVRQRLLVQFDESQTSVDEIVRAVVKLGYTAIPEEG